jgi:hypothetical protein
VTTSVVGLSSWSEITHDFGANWLIYLSMPLIAAFVGWSTKIVAHQSRSKQRGPTLIMEERYRAGRDSGSD